MNVIEVYVGAALEHLRPQGMVSVICYKLNTMYASVWFNVLMPLDEEEKEVPVVESQGGILEGIGMLVAVHPPSDPRRGFFK
jgi:hypothetical protein